MAQFQHQEQEDLVASGSSRKFSMRHFRSRKTFESDRARSKKVARKPTLKPGLSKQTKSKEPVQEFHDTKVSTSQVSEIKAVNVEPQNVFCEMLGFDNGVESMAETMIESTVIAFQILTEIVLEAPKYEEELRFIASVGLIFYGGSWTNLAGVVAAIEAFGTIKTLQEVYEVGMAFLFDESEDGVTPCQIKDNLRQLGLQSTLLMAVVVSPSWAEICITIAFASKFTTLVPVKDLLKMLTSSPDQDENEFDEYFGHIDASWFELIALISCNILSLIFFGCFPRLTTAMYMGYLGVSLFMEGLVNRPINIPVLWDSEIFDMNFWLMKSTQYYTWVIVAVMAVWQAVSGYEGVFLLLSWSMFLYPVVKVYNILGTSSIFKDIKAE